MRYPLRTAIIGSGLILLTHACGKRDQYDRGSVPPNPDPEVAALVPAALDVPNPTLNPALGDPSNSNLPIGSSTGSSGVPAISPAEIVAKVADWNSRPIVWNESAGNIKIGETNWDQWYNEFNAYRRDGNVSYKFINYDVDSQNRLVEVCNTVEKNGTNVCTSTAGVTVFQSYEGTLALPKEDGSFVDVLMNSRLDESVFSKADREGILLEGAAMNDSTRGREFFKRFFQTYIAPRYTDSKTVDCFAEGRCQYQVVPGNYIWLYSAPGGMSGYLYLTRDKNQLNQVRFFRYDSIPVPKALYSENSSVDLLKGSIKLPAVNGGTSFNLGDSYQQFQKIGLPQVTWGGSAGSNSLAYSGITFDFQKSNPARLADTSYAAAEASDPATVMVFDENFEAAISFGGEPLLMLNKAREKFTKEEHIAALNKLRVAAEKEILSGGKGEVLVSQITGKDLQSQRFGAFVLNLIYRFDGKTYQFNYATYLKDSSAYASLEAYRPFEEDLLEVKREGNIVTGFGALTIGEPLLLEDVDLNLTNRATVTVGDAKLRVSLSKFQKTVVSRPNENSNLPDLYPYYEVLKFVVADATVDVVPCKVMPNATANSGYCVLSLYATKFYEPKNVKSYAKRLNELYSKVVSTDVEKAALLTERAKIDDLRASFPTCKGGDQIYINDTKEVARAKLKKDQCLLLTETSEAGDAEKTTFYVFDTSTSFWLDGENNGFVSGFQFY